MVKIQYEFLLFGGTEWAPNSTTDVDVINTRRQVILYDSSKFVNPLVYFETYAKYAASGNPTTLSLYDIGTSDDSSTAGSLVGSSSNAHSASGYTRVRSAALTLVSGRRFKVKGKQTTASATVGLGSAKLIVIDDWGTDPANVTKAQHSVGMTRGEFNTTNAAYQEHTYQALWRYDAAAYDGTVTVYLEATLYTSVASNTAYCELYDGSAQVKEVTTTLANPARVRSAVLTPTDAKDEWSRFACSSASGTTTKGPAHMIYDCVNPVRITKTADAKILNRVQITLPADANITKPVGTIDDTITDDTLGMSTQRKTFYARGYHYVFYSNPRYGYYKSSPDGTTWGTATEFNPPGNEWCANYSHRWSLHFDGKYVHVIMVDGQNNGDYFIYRRGYPELDGTITWSAAQSVATGSNSNYIHSVTVNTEGKVFFCIITNPGAAGVAKVYRNDNTDGTWATASGFPYTITATTGATLQMCIVALASGNVFCLYGVTGATLKGKFYTNSNNTWGGEEVCSVNAVDQSTNYYLRPGFSAVGSPDTNEVHLVYVKTVNYEIYHRWRNTSGTWQAETDLGANTQYKIPEISYYEKTNDLYVIICNTQAAGEIDYQKRTAAGTWDGTWTQLLTGQTNLVSNGTGKASYDCTGLKLGFAFYVGASTPYTLKYVWLDIGKSGLISKTADAQLFSDIKKTITKTGDVRLKKLGQQLTKNANANICWPYKWIKSHVITHSAGAGTNYQVKVRVYRGAGTDSGDTCYNIPCRDDFADVRFLDSTGAIIDSWCESVNGTTYSDWWVEVREDLSSLDRTIYVAVDPTYRYPFGADQAEMDATFPFADHFYGGSLDTVKWDLGYRYESPANSLLTTDPSHATDSYDQFSATIPIGRAIRVKWKIPDAGETTAGCFVSVGFRANINSYECAAMGALKDLGLSYLGRTYRGSGGTGYNSYIGSSGGGTGTSRSLPFSTLLIDEIQRTATKCKWLLSTGTYSEETDTTRYPAGDSRVTIYNNNPGTMTAYEAIDFILVRKFIESEPAHGAWGTLTKRTSMMPKADATLTSAGKHNINKSADTRLFKPANQLTKNANARLKKTANQTTKNADARLLKHQQATKNADARLKKAGNQIQKAADARLRPVPKTKTADARLKKTGNQLTKDSNARLKKLQSTTKPADARLKKAQQATKAADARLRPVAKTKTADARLKKVANQITKTAMARLKATGAVYVTSNARLKKPGQQLTKTADAKLAAGVVTQQLTKNANARLKKAGAQVTKDSNARLKRAGIQLTENSNARLKKAGNQLTEICNARLKKVGIQLTETSDSRLKKVGLQLSINSDARLVAPATHSISKSANARLKGSFSRTIEVDARLRATRPIVIHSNARIVDYSTRTFVRLHGKVAPPAEAHGTIDRIDIHGDSSEPRCDGTIDPDEELHGELTEKERKQGLKR